MSWGIGSDGSGDVNDFKRNRSLHSHQILLYMLLLRRCISMMPIGPVDEEVNVKVKVRSGRPVIDRWYGRSGRPGLNRCAGGLYLFCAEEVRLSRLEGTWRAGLDR